MANTDRYIMGLIENLENLTGTLSSPLSISGKLSNATLRGMAIELRIDGTMLQWKYEDEDTWNDLIDLNNIDYEALQNLPTINGNEVKGEVNSYVMTPDDELSNLEVQNILNR